MGLNPGMPARMHFVPARSRTSVGGKIPAQFDRFGLWSDAEGVHRIEYSRIVLEEIRSAATRGLMRLGRGGIEIGGLLFGTRLGGFLRVLSWQPIACNHARGPSFVLSLDDEQALARQLDQARQQDLQVLGWFVSHTRRGLEMSEEEHRIASRYFPEDWQVTLLVRPHRFGEARGCFHFRSEAGSAWLPRTPDLEIDPITIPAASRDTGAEVREFQVASAAQPPSARGKSLGQWANLALGLALTAGLACSSWAAYYSWRHLRPDDPAPLVLPQLRVEGDRNGFRLAWDVNSDYVVRAQKAWLEFDQDGNKSSVPLDAPLLHGGQFRVISPAPVGSVTLTLLDAQSTHVTETVRWDLTR